MAESGRIRGEGPLRSSAWFDSLLMLFQRQDQGDDVGLNLAYRRFCRPGGESYALLAARIGAFLRDVQGDTIVVGHGGAGRVLRGLYGRLPEDQILALDEPQDAIFRLTQGTIAHIDHGAV